VLNTYVTHARVVEFEPRIADYLASGQSDYTTIIAKAKEVLTQDLRSNNLSLKKLCAPLSLQASAAKTTSFTGAKSEEDIAERRIWVVTVTAAGGTETFTLQGTDDTSSETYTDITTLTFTETGEDTTLFDDVYSYYRVNYSGTSATYSSELVEESFHLAHIYKSLEMIYSSIQARAGDFWIDKKMQYRELYDTMIKNIVYTYDSNLSGSISLGEEQYTYRPSFSR